jgi:hypothetical protein
MVLLGAPLPVLLHIMRENRRQGQTFLQAVPGVNRRVEGRINRAGLAGKIFSIFFLTRKYLFSNIKSSGLTNLRRHD